MSKDRLVIDTFSELAPRYEKVLDFELNRFWGWGYEEFVDHLIASMPIDPGDQILDIATGTTVIPRKISNLYSPNKPIHGLDITLEMLKRARKLIEADHSPGDFCLVCASALSMPYRNEVFNVVICGLATHHMNAREMLSEMARVLQPNGELALADIGGSLKWNLPGIRLVFRLLAFLYYAFQENLTRAWAEASAVTNIRPIEEWHDLLVDLGFENISITHLRSKYKWMPKPLLIRASKNNSGGENGFNE
jgi:ubiquinone/menaquinone biosynthesis C-methylase UbiE